MPVVARAFGVVIVMLFACTGASAPVEPPFWTGRDDVASFAGTQDDRLARAKTIIDAMLRCRDKRTALNTLRPFDRAVFELDVAEAQSSLVQNVHPDAAWREAAEKANQK